MFFLKKPWVCNKLIKKNHGFSLIELMLVLAVIAGLATGVFIIFPKIQTARAAIYEAQIAQSARANIKVMFGARNYRGLTTSLAAEAKFFPEEMVGAGAITHRFGGAVTVGASNSNGDDLTGNASPLFRIVYQGMPTDGCIKMTAVAETNFDIIIVEGLILKNGFTAMDFAPDLAALACSQNDTVDIILISR